MADTRDDQRQKKQIVDKDGIRDASDEILTHKDTDDLAMEDVIQDLTGKE